MRQFIRNLFKRKNPDVESQLEAAADAWVANGMRPMPWHVPSLPNKKEGAQRAEDY